MTERQVQVSDVRAAVEWWSGVDPVIPSKTPHRLSARRVFWGALKELGMAQSQIAEASYVTPAAISLSLKHHPANPKAVATVLQRAKSQVSLECKATR